ncbi:hypothetical protein BDEG_26831 [Batrachochytrium dendrobatidis JEL423]|uniref:Fungal lipase-type domain-containing protein n=1 Tax=Batrachochytrium dendrobatidis (strain JEL423) TaxID=403673 RepID=A0A177WTQ2_BATDL|nr:hypothetical protein BDEG_26831 [Batrachochytrium dendrobatidis JEL423]
MQSLICICIFFIPGITAVKFWELFKLKNTIQASTASLLPPQLAQLPLTSSKMQSNQGHKFGNPKWYKKGEPQKYIWYIDTGLVTTMTTLMQYNAAASCKVVNVASKWECGPLCQDATAGTQIVSLIKDPTRSRTDMSVGYVGINNQLKTIIVSYRGTMGSVDWRQNLRAVTTLIQELYEHPKKHIFNEARVHAGFLSEFMRIRDTVARALLMAISLHPEYKIHITGHSKGGTLATLTAVDLYMTHDLPNIEKKVHLITFGTPRVGNREWAAWLDGIPFAEAIRVIHQNDPVVHLPPIAMGYQHTGVPVLVTADSHVVGCTYYKDRLSDENCLPHSPEKSSHTHNYFHKTGCRLLNEQFDAMNSPKKARAPAT